LKGIVSGAYWISSGDTHGERCCYFQIWNLLGFGNWCFYFVCTHLKILSKICWWMCRYVMLFIDSKSSAKERADLFEFVMKLMLLLLLFLDSKKQLKLLFLFLCYVESEFERKKKMKINVGKLKKIQKIWR